jgi:hypothetical protein
VANEAEESWLPRTYTSYALFLFDNEYDFSRHAAHHDDVHPMSTRHVTMMASSFVWEISTSCARRTNIDMSRQPRRQPAIRHAASRLTTAGRTCADTMCASERPDQLHSDVGYSDCAAHAFTTTPLLSPVFITRLRDGGGGGNPLALLRYRCSPSFAPSLVSLVADYYSGIKKREAPRRPWRETVPKHARQ